MKLKRIIPSEQEPTYKGSIHKTGRIGFAINTAKKFGIVTDRSMILAINADDETDVNFYGILSDYGDKEAYKIQKAGKYHSVNARAFFDSLKIDYSKGGISLDVTEQKIDDTNVIKFSPKYSPRKSKSATS